MLLSGYFVPVRNVTKEWQGGHPLLEEAPQAGIALAYFWEFSEDSSSIGHCPKAVSIEKHKGQGL